MNFDVPKDPLRLHPRDWSELRAIIRDLVRAEVQRALDARDAPAEPAAGGGCVGGCHHGWLPCGLCFAGALPTFDGSERGWRPCPRCAGSGEPGCLRCPVCNASESG